MNQVVELSKVYLSNQPDKDVKVYINMDHVIYLEQLPSGTSIYTDFPDDRFSVIHVRETIAEVLGKTPTPANAA